MDWRLIVVLLPVIVALSWAVYNIIQAALSQVQSFLNKES
ncbi:MAG: photosystem II protein Y [Cyanobacteria bacterium J055]|nr:MAG: photosystem II protein Y [Cyanobacteria bacterium J055]